MTAGSQIGTFGLLPPHLKVFLAHAARHSPYYREQEWAKNLLAGLPIRLQDIPITSKAAVLENPKAFRSDFDPPGAGPVHVKHTSGSTGAALELAKSSSHFEVNQQENRRLLQPWNLQQYKTLVECRPPSEVHPSGKVESSVMPQGQRRVVIYTSTVADIAAQVMANRAESVLARPSQILAMLEDGNDYNFLKMIRTSTEAVSDELRATIAKLPNCRHLDLYGSVETALIALNCPRCGNYHLAHANGHIEILNDNDQPAKPGELGRIVATVFSNPSTPLIRYDLGDWVRFTTSTPCEPGQVALQRIYGRARMIFRLPDGGTILPALDAEAMLALGVKRFKLVQTKLDEIEFRYKTISGVDDLDHEKMRRQIATDMTPLFKVKLVMVSEFPLAPSGKYLMHERLIP
jgi:phenylacetate-coenzyme A ligase PaaK-like adenylate-forming protein